MVKGLFLLAALALALPACQQNPLGEYPDWIQNGVPPAKKPIEKPNVPTNPEFARILSSDPWWDMEVDKEFEIELTAKAFVKEEDIDTFEVEMITGPPEGEEYSLERIDLENPKKTEQKFLFKWKPSRELMEDETKISTFIEFRMVAEGKTLIFREERIPVFIHRVFAKPKILSIDGPSTLKEGEAGTYLVKVEDLDSETTNPPNIDLTSQSLYSNLTPFVRYQSRKQLDLTTWEYVYTVNTEDKDITPKSTNSSTYSAKFRAVSSFGVSSNSKTLSVQIQNKVQKPKVSAPKEAEFAVGSGINLFMTAVDPKNSGDLSAKIVSPESLADLPGEAKFSTKKVSGALQLIFTWDIPKSATITENIYNFEVDVANKGKEGSGYVTEVTKHKFKVELLEEGGGE